MKSPLAITIFNSTPEILVLLLSIVRSCTGVELFSEGPRSALIVDSDVEVDSFATKILELLYSKLTEENTFEIALDVPQRLVWNLTFRNKSDQDEIKMAVVTAMLTSRSELTHGILSARAGMYTAYWTRLA